MQAHPVVQWSLRIAEEVREVGSNPRFGKSTKSLSTQGRFLRVFPARQNNLQKGALELAGKVHLSEALRSLTTQMCELEKRTKEQKLMHLCLLLESGMLILRLILLWLLLVGLLWLTLGCFAWYLKFVAKCSNWCQLSRTREAILRLFLLCFCLHMRNEILSCGLSSRFR